MNARKATVRTAADQDKLAQIKSLNKIDDWVFGALEQVGRGALISTRLDSAVEVDAVVVGDRADGGYQFFQPPPEFEQFPDLKDMLEAVQLWPILDFTHPQVKGRIVPFRTTAMLLKKLGERADAFIPETQIISVRWVAEPHAVMGGRHEIRIDPILPQHKEIISGVKWPTEEQICGKVPTIAFDKLLKKSNLLATRWEMLLQQRNGSKTVAGDDHEVRGEVAGGEVNGDA